MATQPLFGSQGMPLLRTKLYIPPPRPGQVPRPRLIERLNEGLDRRLTLISAPAGFGKTTLVSEWIHCRGAVIAPAGGTPPPLQVAWLSLDEGDNDPVRFLTYLIAALQAGLRAARQTVDANIGQGILGALQSPQPPPIDAVLAALVNEIAAHSTSARTVLVLDDYHLIEAQPVHDALTFLLRHLPQSPASGVHLVIATRADPPLPLARLRARGQLTELRVADLRFTPVEAAAFLKRVTGLDLSEEAIAALERRTEGWIAGLHLAALALHGASTRGGHGGEGAAVSGFIASFTGRHHFVLDYLVDEVLEQQTENIQAFLLQTAILDRLTGPLCDAVLLGDATLPSQTDSRATLEMLDRTNLFIIPLDDERRWYRYHRLFSDLLRERLRQRQPEQLSILHSRASEWYEQNGFADDAIDHAFRADDIVRAANLVDRVAEDVWLRGQDTKLRRWLTTLPGELISSKPNICILRAWSLFTSGQTDEAERTLQAAEGALGERSSLPRTDRATRAQARGRNPPSGSDGTKLRGRITALRSFIASYRGDVPGIIQHAHQALEDLPEQDLTWRGITAMVLGDAYRFRGELAAAYRAQSEATRACEAAGDTYFIIAARLKLALTLRAQGQPRRTAEICRQQLQLADELGLSQTRTGGWALAMWGEALAEMDELDRALDQVKEGVERIERSGDLAMLHSSHLGLIRVLFSHGDLAGVQEVIGKMEQIARERDIPPWVASEMAAWQARVWLVQGNLEAASRWAQERGLDVDGEPPVAREVEYLALARIRIAQERPGETAGLLQGLLERAEAGGHTTRAIEVLLLQALALQAQGETDQSLAALERALTLAEPGGLIRAFADQGPPMAHLLYQAAARGIKPGYIGRLLTAFPDLDTTPAARLEILTRPQVYTEIPKSKISKSDIIEPLSERELQVLELIAEGLTNPEIASRLFLSLNTVKSHAHNIYGKLGVRNRTQAVSRARALGLLAPI